jgi:acyl-CoA thioesterase YciA
VTEAPHPLVWRSRRWVRPEDLNAHGTLFGGSLLRWIDEEAAIHAITQLGTERVVTKFMSEIDFVSSASQGDLLEMELEATEFGRTSVTMRCEVRNMFTRDDILTIARMVFVGLDEDGRPRPHGYTTATDGVERIPVRPARPFPRGDRSGS